MKPTEENEMEIAVLLYDNFTALDCIGPYEVLSRLPGARVRFVSAKGGPVTADTRMLTIQTEASIADVSAPEIVLVPGGPGDEGAAADHRVLAWLKRVHETTKWTLSVCTGSIVLGAAGLLKGLEATTHWSRYDRLAELGAKPVEKRFVRSGKIITAAGVSAGIDMALELVRIEQGDQYAQGLQLAIEYDPDPPFDCGSPKKAPEHVLEMIRAIMSDPTRRQVATA
jgi:transcriptional regulator GlxA family with amidase domain